MSYIKKGRELEYEMKLKEVCQEYNESQAWKGHVILCPGGGYRWLSPREEMPVAEAFAKQGWKPWILYYTVSDSENVLGNLPLFEAAEAVRRVREVSLQKPVLLCGFSAGAHVAASLGVHWNDRNLFPEWELRIQRPDALILCYPVITSGKYAHRGSIQMLAGETNADYFSLENYVSDDTPPTFLWHTASDHTVPVQNSLLFAAQLAQHQIPFELHIYPYGEHGLSLATKETEEPAKKRYADSHVAGWFWQCMEWLKLIERMI